MSEKQEGQTKIGMGVYISGAAVLVICSAVYIFGIQSQRLNELTDRVGRMETYTADVISMKERMEQMTLTLAEVRQDVKDIRNAQLTKK